MEIKQTQDICVERLTTTDGRGLQIMANIASPAQINAMLEGHIYAFLGSRYIPDRTEMLLRLTVSYQGRGRDDLVTIARSSAVQGFNSNSGGNLREATLE